jgi:DNA-binding NtrC family response regulator
MSTLKAVISAPATFGKSDELHRVLFVDDDPAILFAYSKLLEREGICVDSCECLLEAIEHITTCSYLAVVTDLRLAETENTDGLDVMRTLRKVQPGAQIILTSGYSNAVIEQTARDMGATHFFEKPVIPAKILEAIKSLISAAGRN